MGDEFINFEQLNASSEIIYYSHTIRDNTFHNFIIKNTLHPFQPKEMDDLTYKIFILALKQIEKQNSYNNELMVRDGKNISEEELNSIINEMNGTLFKFEEFTKKIHIDLF
jgi:hypothetical protein